MDICEILARGVVNFVVAAAVASVGIYVYFRQKEYELVQTRYLEGCLDVISTELEQAIGVMNHNWARCLHILKTFRDEKEHFDVKELEKGFIDYDASQFQSIAHHRLRNLIGSDAFWKAFQLAVSFVNTSNSVITKEIPDAVRMRLETEEIQKPIKTIVDHGHSKLNEINQASFRYGLITQQLQLIADVLEKERMGFRNLRKFRRNPIVDSAIKQIEKEFKEEYSKYDQTTA